MIGVDPIAERALCLCASVVSSLVCAAAIASGTGTGADAGNVIPLLVGLLRRHLDTSGAGGTGEVEDVDHDTVVGTAIALEDDLLVR